MGSRVARALLTRGSFVLHIAVQSEAKMREATTLASSRLRIRLERLRGGPVIRWRHAGLAIANRMSAIRRWAIRLSELLRGADGC